MAIREISFTKTPVNYKDIRKNPIQFMTVNHSADKKVYVISDIHGDFNGFMSMLKTINFTYDDEMYILGDVIDRGPDGIKCLQYIMKHKNIHMILGNHELIMYDALFDQSGILHWCERNGGYPTLLAFMALNKQEQADIVDFINSLPLSYNITVGDRTVTLCHASNPAWFKDYINSDNIIEKYYNIVDYAVWYRGEFEFAPRNSGDVIIGHTPTLNFMDGSCKDPYSPIIFQGEGTNVVDIDCGNAYKEIDSRCRLCCLYINEMEVNFI